jgi:hypothetical protein
LKRELAGLALTQEASKKEREGKMINLTAARLRQGVPAAMWRKPSSTKGPNYNRFF